MTFTTRRCAVWTAAALLPTLLLVTTFLAPAAPARAQDNDVDQLGVGRDALRWGRAQKLPGYVFAPGEFTLTSVNGTQPSGTILFRAFDLRLDRNDVRDAVSRTISLRVPATISRERVLRGFRTDVRGFLSKGRDASISVSLEVGGVRKILEAPEGRRLLDYEIDRTYTSRFDDRGGSTTGGGGFGDNDNYVLLAQVNTRTKYYDVRITLRITRPRGSDAEGYIALDSLDFAALMNGGVAAVATESRPVRTDYSDD